MSNYFNKIKQIEYLGPDSTDPLSYRYYDAKRKVLGKTMQEHLRMAVCYWHTFCWAGNDNFGEAAFNHPWLQGEPMPRAEKKVDAMFELVEKLGLPFFTFHDRDVAPEGKTFKDSLNNLQKITELLAKGIERTGIQLLWGTANLFSHQRYLAGAATNPNPEIFAYACAQVKAAMDATQQLNGANYVLWGGREGYDTILNTDLNQEAEQFARFLHMVAEYKHKIGFKGALLIEPKPCEPTKHQYDYDSATVFAFLQKYGLEKEFKVNIEANHAILAGHDFVHEISYAFSNDIFGSIDANRGDPRLGWDTDQFPIDISIITHAVYILLQNGGFSTGGFNFDSKLRRQSIDLEDFFYGHISGVDTLARGLLNAAKLIESNQLQDHVNQRYHEWNSPLGQDIMAAKMDLTALNKHVLTASKEPQPISGQQEMLENLMNRYVE